MAKTSIADRYEGGSSSEKPMPRELQTLLWLGASDGTVRLGEAAEMIEVIKIAPLPSTSATRVRVKIVIIELVGSDKGVTKIEAEFYFDCNDYSDCIAEALSQQIVVAFSEAVRAHQDALYSRATKLTSILLRLAEREINSGDNVRCPNCGRKMISVKEEDLICERCEKVNPA